jgi:hypothetical protein
MQATLSIARLALTEARAARLHWLLAALVAAAAALGEFAARLALAEAGQVRTASTAAFLRIAAVGVIATFGITSIMRDRQDGYWRFLFARPLARRSYVFGKGLALAALAVLAALSAGMLLAAQGGVAASRVVAWTLLFWSECVLAALFALACALSLAHTVHALAASVAFYLLARSSGNLLALASEADHPIVTLVGMLLPRLDLFARAEWLLYTAPFPMAWLGLQILVYATLLLALAVADLGRRAL